MVLELRQSGHDVLTVQEDGRSGADDDEILDRALALTRVTLSHNRRHFERLHRQGHPHCGIVTCIRNQFAVLIVAGLANFLLAQARKCSMFGPSVWPPSC